MSSVDTNGTTSEFSICLALDPKTTQAVNAIRETLPASPYRDDTPHVTLLRTIKCPSQMSDADLLQDMEKLLGISKNLPLTATVHKPANMFSPLFRTSSQVRLHASPEMKSYRKHIMRTLKANNYSIGAFERLAFLPHISVRLGIAYTKHAKAMTKHSFSPKTKLTFNKWIILRAIKKDGKYLVKEITIES
jgi:hypothetical protein